MIALGHIDKPAACLVKVCIPLNQSTVYLSVLHLRTRVREIFNFKGARVRKPR